MSKESFSTNIFVVLINTIKIYFSNIDKFILYMLFPVLGQVLGIVLALGIPAVFADKITDKTTNVSSAMLFVILMAVPGILIFLKAFWDYMVAYVALNSMAEGAVMTGKVYDFSSHNEVATRRSFKYIGFLIVLTILISILTTPFFIVPATIAWVYFILIFQVFTFEQDLTIKECYLRSFNLIKGNWFKTVILLVLLIFFSIYIISQGVSVVFDYLNLSGKICSFFDFVGNAFPLDRINAYLNVFELKPITVQVVSEIIYMTILSTIVAGLTLPIRTICWALWYKGLSDRTGESGNPQPKPKMKKKSKKITKEE